MNLKPKDVVYSIFQEYKQRNLIDVHGGGIALLDAASKYFHYLPSEMVYQWPKKKNVAQKLKSAVDRGTDADVCAGLFEIPSGMLNVTAVIHTHSVRAIKFSRAIVLGQKIEWIADENTKGIFNRAEGKEFVNGQAISIPVIENGIGDELIKCMNDVFKDNPKSCSVMVKEHGLFVFGKTWQQAKKECEVIEKKFELA